MQTFDKKIVTDAGDVSQWNVRGQDRDSQNAMKRDILKMAQQHECLTPTVASFYADEGIVQRRKDPLHIEDDFENDYFCQDHHRRYRHILKRYNDVWNPSQLMRLIMGTMPTVGMVHVPLGIGPDHRVRPDDTKTPVTTLIQTQVKVRVTEEAVEAREETADLFGGASAPRLPSAQALRDEDDANGIIRELIEQADSASAEQQLRRLRLNLDTMLTTEVEEPKRRMTLLLTAVYLTRKM